MQWMFRGTTSKKYLKNSIMKPIATFPPEYRGELRLWTRSPVVHDNYYHLSNKFDGLGTIEYLPFEDCDGEYIVWLNLAYNFTRFFRNDLDSFFAVPPKIKRDGQAGRVTLVVDTAFEALYYTNGKSDSKTYMPALEEKVLKYFGVPAEKIVFLTSAHDIDYDGPITIIHTEPWAGQVSQGIDPVAWQSWAQERIRMIVRRKISATRVATCYNRRVLPSRAVMLNWLQEINLLEKTWWSWGGKDCNIPTSSMDMTGWPIPVEAITHEWRQRDQVNFPDEGIDLTNNAATIVDMVRPGQSWFQIVNETSYTDLTFPTEKSYKPFVQLQPFVVWGPAGNVQALRERGYRVFDKWIDHSYDREVNSWSRFQALTTELKRLYNLDKHSWSTILLEMLPDLEWNYERCMADGSVARNSILYRIDQV